MVVTEIALRYARRILHCAVRTWSERLCAQEKRSFRRDPCRLMRPKISRRRVSTLRKSDSKSSGVHYPHSLGCLRRDAGNGSRTGEERRQAIGAPGRLSDCADRSMRTPVALRAETVTRWRATSCERQASSGIDMTAVLTPGRQNRFWPVNVHVRNEDRIADG